MAGKSVIEILTQITADSDLLAVDRDDLEPLCLLEVEVSGGNDNVVPDVPAASVILHRDHVGPVVCRPGGYVNLKYIKEEYFLLT